MDQTISSYCLQQVVERAHRLYSLPAVAAKVIELTDSQDIDVQALKSCIENDPALCAKVLRVVNSSLFGLGSPVSDLGQALALLGTKPLKMLVLGFSLPTMLFAELTRDVLEFYWRGALTKAVAAREISEHIWKTAGDEPFVTGLLQDLGILVLLQDFGGPYLQFVKTVVDSRKDLRSLEVATFGFDHSVLSAELLTHWHFPEHVAQAVGMPHDVVRVFGLPPEQRRLPQILHLAELLTQVLARERTELFGELLEVAEQYCRLKPRQLESLVAIVQEKVAQLADVLSLDLPNDRDYVQVLLQAQSQLAEVAEAVAREGTPGPALDENLSRASRQLASIVEAAVSGPGDSRAESSAAPTVVATEPALDDAALIGRVASALAACRQSRSPLSLAMVAMDDYQQLVVTRGVEGVQSLVTLLETAARRLCYQNGDCLHLGDGQFAVILEQHDRMEAIEAGRRLLRGMRQWSQLQSTRGLPAITISVGLATLRLPPKNFPPREMIDAVSRCVFAAQASGGDVLKSIDLC
jgi:HD-like signal output (HDOD) protein/GGDEF domain-containing protein